MYWSFGEVYCEARLFPEAPLRFFLRGSTWLCVGVGIASITIGRRKKYPL
jgi:hypothetical protein